MGKTKKIKRKDYMYENLWNIYQRENVFIFFFKFSQLILQYIVWKPACRICVLDIEN